MATRNANNWPPQSRDPVGWRTARRGCFGWNTQERGRFELFCRAAFLDSAATRIFGWLAPYTPRPMPHVEPFAQVAGELMTHLNMLHPFREGNGRPQREFVRRVPRFHGFHLDYERINGERYMAALIADDPRVMTDASQAAIVNPSPDRRLRTQYQSDAERDWQR